VQPASRCWCAMLPVWGASNDITSGPAPVDCRVAALDAPQVGAQSRALRLPESSLPQLPPYFYHQSFAATVLRGARYNLTAMLERKLSMINKRGI
jgi:hypothetical protein